MNRESIAVKNIWLELRCNEVEELLKINKMAQTFRLIIKSFKYKSKKNNKLSSGNR